MTEMMINELLSEEAILSRPEVFAQADTEGVPFEWGDPLAEEMGF